MKYYPQLNIQTAYNFQESLISIDDYLAFAVEHNFTYAFYADCGVMYGAAEFYDKFSAAGIKPIIGLTYETSFHDQKVVFNFYAKNHQGYQNLCILASELQVNKLDSDDFFKFAQPHFDNNLVYVVSFEKTVAEQLLEEWFTKVESTNLFFGTTNPLVNDFQTKNNVVASKRIAYLNVDDASIYRTLLAIKENKTITEMGVIADFHYPSYEVDVENLNQANLKKIVAMVDFDLFAQPQNHLIEFKTPNAVPQVQFLRQVSLDSLVSYLRIYKIAKNEHQKYYDRLDLELKIIEEMGFANYFLIVRDYVWFAKNHQIMVGPGRGSAAGSLVAFLLRITTVDPLKYDLVFERFLNPERKTMPDIDIDFQDDRREEVVEYLFEKYGMYHVASIITYQTIGAKSALRDVIRAFAKPVEFANKLTRLIPLQFQSDLSGAIAHSKALKIYAEDNAEIFSTALRLIGLPRQTGTHAAGIVLCQEDLRTVLPIKIGYNGIMQTQFDMNYLERLGLIKMDLLGLRNLTTLEEIKENIARSEGIDINFDKLDLNDQKVYQLLQSGKTSGIFQLESPGMTKLLVQMQPTKIDDISATSALFRPGPSAMIPEYLKRRSSKKKVNSYIIDPSLTNILASTYGIILYQEQVLQVLQMVGGFSLGKADLVRRAMSKKNAHYMGMMKPEFISQALKNGYSQRKAAEIWTWIADFASYGFNKSHSIAYSYISYWLSWLKTYYPEQFYVSLFNASVGNPLKVTGYIKEIDGYGIDFKGPSIRNVNSKYVAYNKMILAPLTIIKGVGPEFLRKLQELWKTNKTIFDDFYLLIANLIDKGMSKSLFEALIWAGAFDFYRFDRFLLVENIDLLYNFALSNQNKVTIDLLTIPELTTTKVVEKKLLAQKELEYLGFYLANNPFATKRKEYSSYNVLTLEQIKAQHQKGFVIASVDAIRTKRDKNNHLMAFLDLSDDSGTLKATMFSSQYEKQADYLHPGVVILMKIVVQEYNNQLGAIVENIGEYLN